MGSCLLLFFENWGKMCLNDHCARVCGFAKELSMKQSKLFVLWGVFFIICAALGFIPEPQGATKGLLVALGVLFFVPPALVLHRAKVSSDRRCICLIRNLSLLSLGATVVTLIVNFASLTLPEWLGNALYGLLIVVSTPMVCAQYWLVSLFLWACLLMASLRAMPRRERKTRMK